MVVKMKVFIGSRYGFVRDRVLRKICNASHLSVHTGSVRINDLFQTFLIEKRSVFFVHSFDVILQPVT